MRGSWFLVLSATSGVFMRLFKNSFWVNTKAFFMSLACLFINKEICHILLVFLLTTKISEGLGYLEFNCMILERTNLVVGIRQAL